MSLKERVAKWLDRIRHPVRNPGKPGKTDRRTRRTWAQRQKQRDVMTDASSDWERKMAMIAELETAKKEWIVAQKKFDYAVEKDQIDYAIYALEAAEKRYEMLLRSAKRERLSLRNEATGRIMEVR